MTDSVVAEGQVKFRDGKKWKTRWVVLRKPSPVADCLYLLVYKEKKKGKEKGINHKERLNVTLEGICGVEPGSGYDGVSYTLSILCVTHTLVLGFNNRDALLAWDSRVCYSLGEVHRLSVNVEPGTKLESGPAFLHLCNSLLVLSRGVPPVVIGHWKLSALRRYGAVPNGFVFEGGTRCGYWAGVFFLSCSEGEHISFLFDCMVRGITPNRAPHGLRPALPGLTADLNADALSAEKRISLEASELEKRLSMLSNCSLASSTASTYSFNTSVASDDQSSISSSSSSQSDASYGSRLPFWVDPSARPHLSNQTASSPLTLKAQTSSDDQLYAAVMGSSSNHSSSNQLHLRGLHDSGRQSSLDSGIGIAAGSQSSYSGSCSSYTGSLDTTCPGGEEEFGSLSSLTASPPLPPPPPPSSVPPQTPPPPPPPFLSTLASGRSSATSLCPSRSSSSASGRHGEEYQTPSLLGLWYDTPRSVQAASVRGSTSQVDPPELGADRDSRDGGVGHEWGIGNSPKGPGYQHQATMQCSQSWGSERAPSVDSEGSTPQPQLMDEGFVCGESQIQCSHGADNYITPEQWRSVRSRCANQMANLPLGLSSSADTKGPPLLVIEEYDIGFVSDKLAGLKRLVPISPPSAPPPLPLAQSAHRPTSILGIFQSAHEAYPSVSLDTGLHGNSTVNYVNIPISALPAKTNIEPVHTELNLQEHGSAPGFSASRGNSLQLCRSTNNPQP
ncbi:protein Dok-7-like [Halichoeres trimaculatus]|uniref:protein Dok-7-like n=1 Tax=Halichoeres trimaculatus TaxID=147232 RepID=UPI003D9E018C